MRRFYLFTVLILFISSFINLNAQNFWEQFSNTDEHIQDLVVIPLEGSLEETIPYFLTANGKLIYYTKSELTIPDKKVFFNSIESNFNYFYVGTNTEGVYSYNINTKQWNEFNTGLTDKNMKVLCSSNQSVVASTSDGTLWQLSLPEIG